MTITIHHGTHHIGGCVTEYECDGWHLIRNNNGEWISDENVVFLTKQEARHLKIITKLSGKKISIQHGGDG